MRAWIGKRAAALTRAVGRAVPRRRISARGVTFVALSLAMLAATAYFLWPVLAPDRGGQAGAITVQLSMSGFSPSRIDARAGVPLTVRLVNKDSRFHTDGGGWHQFAVDELGVDAKVAPLGTDEITITPDSSGTYEFYCGVCCGGRENPYMVGTLTVGTPA